MGRSPVFKDCSSLVEDLKKKSKKYPLIAELYIPIIKAHENKYKKEYETNNLDTDDWLHILYFQHLYLDLEEWAIFENLNNTEQGLKLINKSLDTDDTDGFKELCTDLLKSSMHPTINGVHNKLLDFFGELKGMLYFIKAGYNVKRIPTFKNKTADFSAEKEAEITSVECKFIHASNKIKSFIKRHLMYRSVVEKCHYILSPDLFDCENPPKDLNKRDLEKKDISTIKEFISDILINKRQLANIILPCGCTITYKDTVRPCCITIGVQVAFWGDQLKRFLEGYIRIRAEQASIQLKNHIDTKKCVYIFVELDGEYNILFEEMEHTVKSVLKEFKEKGKFDFELIIEIFPYEKVLLFQC